MNSERIIEDVAFFGGQDSDNAIEYLAEGNFLHALNILNNSSGVGNKGVVTNMKGNTEVVFELPDGENLTIGSAEDHENNLFYFFNYNSSGYHGIYQFNAIRSRLFLPMELRLCVMQSLNLSNVMLI